MGYTNLPQLLVGQEDLQQLVALGKNFGKSLSGVLEKGIYCVEATNMYVYHIVPRVALTFVLLASKWGKGQANQLS